MERFFVPMHMKGVSSMSCKHPLKAWQIGLTPNGKPDYKITSYDVQYLVEQSHGTFVPCMDSISSDGVRRRITEFVEIPCGHCIACRLNYAKQWADRCMLELKYHDKACWITLTYDDKHLPPCEAFIDDDGVISYSPVHPLCKRDLQLFFKRLRKKYPNKKIRYFGCGEYGSDSMRPHYHVILYGVDFSEDREVWKIKKLGEEYNVFYKSATLERLWSDPNSGERLGLCSINNVTYETCSYTARYTSKKLQNKYKGIYEGLGIPPEFTVCSRRPGIGRQYYEDHMRDIYEDQEIFISDKKKGRKIRPPRYFDKLYEIDDPEDYAVMKSQRREFAELNNYLKGSLTSLSYLDMLGCEEEVLLSKVSALKRKEI